MSESDTNQLIEKVETLWRSSTELLQSSALMRGVGYGLFLLAVVDLIYLVVPPNLMNPAWEFQTFGAIVERVAVPLIALLLIFWGGRNGRFKFEFPLLKGLSWLSLVAGILLFLAIPLTLFNTVRLDRQSNSQITAQLEQGKTQLEQIQEQLSGVTTESQMQELIGQFSGTGNAPDLQGQQLETIKQQLSSSLAQGQSNLSAQARNAQRNQRLALLKNSLKWNIGALVSGFLFLWIWLLTNWARKSRRV